MTTTETIAAPSNGKVKHAHEDLVVAETTRMVLELKKLNPSPMNPRKTFDERDIKELAESIKTRGLAVPLKVRPISGGKHELVFGERRYRALLLLGETHVGCDVCALTDGEVRELMLAEFLHRKDLTPMEEAEAFDALRDDRKISNAELALLVAKSESYVGQRLRLLALCKKARQEMQHGRLLLGAALQLARLDDHAAQEKILPRLVGNKDTGQSPVGADEARGTVLDQLHVLARAPFDRKDAELVAAAGACAVCPKRTLAQREMFGDDDPKAEDKCTDGKCWDGKVKAHSKKLLADAKAKGLPIVDNLPKDTWGYSEDEVSWSAPYVDVTRSTNIGSKTLTWKEALKDSGVKIYTAVDPKGGAHELADRKAAEAWVKKQTPQKRAGSGSSAGTRTSSKSGARDDDMKREDLIDEAENNALLATIVEKAEKASPAQVLRIGIATLLQCGGFAEVAVIERRGWKGNAMATINSNAEGMALAQLQGLFAELAASDPYTARDEVTSALKINTKALRKKVEADFKATEVKKNTAAPASPAKSAKAAPKKKAAKKGGKR